MATSPNKPTSIWSDRKKRFKIFAYMIEVSVLLGFAVILFNTFRITVLERKEWNAFDNRTRKDDVYAPATRGNIFSDNGTALAISVPRYAVYLDFRAGGFSDSVFLSNLDAMSGALSEYFRDKSKGAYKSEIRRAFDNRKKRGLHRLIKREVTHTELRDMRQMPYLSIRNRNRSGLVTNMAIRREKPFGTMASRTIGNLQKDVDSMQITHGSSGLELSFDSLLCGYPGKDMLRLIGGSWARYPKVLPINGKDLHTTINVAIQDITERSLREMLIEVDADWGCAIVMEVETGAIKALSNLDRQAPGSYAESTNHALADLLEPGSTFKVASIMAALEEGAVEPSDTFDTGNGLYTYAKRVVRDHNAHKGGYGRISVAQSIHFSSNVGVVKAVLKSFERNPKQFVKHLDDMSFFVPIEMEIPGVAHARIERDTDRWAKTSLPWISFGYETMIPPIYTCRFYNAIANDGKMMEPYIITEIRDKNEVIEEHEPRVVNRKIASSRTLKQMREMLRGVVTDGTATDANSPYVAIAGKTGTAQRSAGAAGYAGQGHNVSFCGFFPYEKPKYTCMVVVSRPRNGYPSGGRIAGGVVRSIAEHVYATTMSIPLSDIKPDSAALFKPIIYGGARAAVKEAATITGTKPHDIDGRGDWLVPRSDSEHLNDFEAFDIEPGVVPRLVGLTLADAVFVAERSGLRVFLVGRGARVTQQSIAPGRHFSGSSTITLHVR